MLNVIGGGRLRSQAGSILFVVAAGIVAFIGIAGLAIDLGMLYNVRTDLQNAMDAAAMAAATQLNGRASGINNAVTQAMNATNNYYFNTTTVDVAAADVTFSASRDCGGGGYGCYVDQATATGVAPTIRFVRVHKEKPIDLALLKVIPGVGSTTNVSAEAVAGQSPPVNVVNDGLIPIAPNSADGPFVAGVETVLRFASAPRYLVLDLPPIVGAGPVSTLTFGVHGSIGIGDPVPLDLFVPKGHVIAGLTARFNSDTESSVGIGYSLYTQNGIGNGRRILPLAMVSGSPPSLSVYDLVCFFMTSPVDPSTGDITGEFISQCNSNGRSDPSRPAAGASGLPSQRRVVLYR